MKKLLWLFLLLSGSCFGQGFFYSLPQPFPNTTITVCPLGAVRPCPSPSSIFNDAALTSPVVNPSNIGPGGLFGFNAAAGQYTIQMGAPTFATFNITLGGGGGGGGTTYPILLPDGTVTTPQLSSSTNPTDGFYIAAGFPNWIFEVAGTQVLALRGSVSGSVRAIALGSSASLCFANGNTLDGNASSNCDGYLHRVAANEIGFGSTGGSNDGTFTTGTFLPTVAVSLPSGTNGNASLFFTADTPSLGLVRVGGGNDVIHWWDDTGAGGGLWGFNGTNAATLWVNEALGSAFIGFTNDSTNGPCSHCLIVSSGSLASSTDGSSISGPFAATQYLTSTPCAATGSTANPSLVACSAASAGVFSCATAASTGTCVISSTAITTSSTILVNPSSAEGTQIGVTCNTAPTLVPTILLKSKTTGSFTINMPTITVNPECFTFLVVN